MKIKEGETVQEAVSYRDHSHCHFSTHTREANVCVICQWQGLFDSICRLLVKGREWGVARMWNSPQELEG